MKKIYFMFVFILLFSVLAQNKSLALTSSGEYSIQSYNIEMSVNENNTFDITEEITAFFKKPKHGIFRKIPTKNRVERLDGTTSSNTAKISNISVSEQYTTSWETGYKVIKIGSEDKEFVGTHKYTIKYTYDIGKDKLKEADELYYNLIGTEWDTDLNNITFKITMPKTFDKSQLGFSSGPKGSTNSSNIYYNVDENVIRGSVIGSLEKEEGLTIRLTLPEGYFIGASAHTDWYGIIVAVVCFLFTITGYLLWNKYAKDSSVVETVEFYPPAGYNSAEIGLMYNGEADDSSVISLLVYLANKGYLKIEKDTTSKKEKEFKITRVKNYDGNNENEKLFFEGLFKKRDRVDYKKLQEIMKEAKKNGQKMKYEEAEDLATDKTENESATATDLYDNFYTTLSTIKSNLNSKENKEKIFEQTPLKMKKWILLMILTIIVSIQIRPLIELGEYASGFIPILVFSLISIAVLIGTFDNKKPTKKVLGVTWGILAGIIPWIGVPILVFEYTVLPLILYVLETACLITLGIIYRKMSKRTPFGKEMLGKIEGYKRFLETAEKEKLEMLVEQNPEYFYDMLPFAYALGVSYRWMKQFETIALKPPQWYGYTDSFDINSFSTFMNTTMVKATSVMSSSVSSDTGGGSGGGFSGGGSGGGGGGSW